MKEIFQPKNICGTIRVPASKSQAHRALICAALAGNSKISGLSPSDDMTATLQALKALGADVEVDFDKGMATFQKPLKVPSTDEVITVDSGESASTLRFMIPIAAALGKKVKFVGHGRLPKRTTELYKPLLEANGVKTEYPENGDFLPLTVNGKLTKGVFEIRGDVSSQFITGLLFAIAIMGEGEIKLTTKLESRPYADMTVDMLRKFGVYISEDETSYRVTGGKFTPTDTEIEGDCSQSAFFAVAAAVGGNVTLRGINQHTKQGDFKLFEIIRNFGAKVTFGKDYITIEKGELHASDIDASDIPDLVPALAVLAAYSNGRTRIFNAGRLRLKESDRILSTIDMIRLLGGEVVECEDGMRIKGKPKLNGGKVKSYGDHRIAMSAAAASVGCEYPVEVDEMNCISKSFPNFTEMFKMIQV